MKRVILWIELILLAQVTEAAELRRALGTPTVIENGEGVSRMLFQLAEPLSAGAIRVSRASVTVLMGEGEEEPIALRLYAISREWTPGSVSWTAGWANPGGDVHEKQYAQARLDPEVHEIVFDVGGMMKEWLEHGLPVHGFLLTVEPADGMGLPIADAERIGRAGTGELVVEYRLGAGGAARAR